MKLRQALQTMALITVVMSLTATTFAQNPGGGPPGGGGPGQGQRQMRNQGSGPMFVIRMSTVQTHLRLTQDQIEEINNLRGPGGPGGGPGGPGGGPGGPGGGPGGPGGPGGGPGGPGGSGGGQPPRNPLADILNEQQVKRLNELVLQWDAPMTMLDPRHGQALELTENQRQRIDQIIRENMPRPEPGTEPPTFQQMLQRKRTAKEAAMQVLTNEQRQTWNRLTGAAFTNWVEPPRPNR